MAVRYAKAAELHVNPLRGFSSSLQGIAQASLALLLLRASVGNAENVENVNPLSGLFLRRLTIAQDLRACPPEHRKKNNNSEEAWLWIQLNVGRKPRGSSGAATIINNKVRESLPGLYCLCTASPFLSCSSFQLRIVEALPRSVAISDCVS